MAEGPVIYILMHCMPEAQVVQSKTSGSRSSSRGYLTGKSGKLGVEMIGKPYGPASTRQVNDDPFNYVGNDVENRNGRRIGKASYMLMAGKLQLHSRLSGRLAKHVYWLTW
jgi:hypothetical protein